MTFGILDVLLALLFLVICILSIVAGLVRQSFSLLVLYLATVAAGLLYPYLSLFVGAVGGKTPTLTHFVTFWVIFTGVTVTLEVLLRKGFPDTRLPALGFLDHLLGLLPGIVCGAIVASLLVATLGHAPQQTWGKALEGLRSTTAYLWESCALRPLLTRFLSIYLDLHKLWMPVLPPIFHLG
ncbi:MAG: CvpA family protein [Thermoflexales bacterium]|nr:CvpA family protein [Thermoflexales bacterium]